MLLCGCPPPTGFELPQRADVRGRVGVHRGAAALPLSDGHSGAWPVGGGLCPHLRAAVVVRGQLRLGQLGRRRAASLSKALIGESRASARVHRYPSPQIGERHVRSTIAAVDGADEREERRILGNGQQLAVAKGPPRGAKFPAKMRISAMKGSDTSWLLSGRERSRQRDDEVDAQERLQIVVGLAAPDRGDGRRATSVAGVSST